MLITYEEYLVLLFSYLELPVSLISLSSLEYFHYSQSPNLKKIKHSVDSQLWVPFLFYLLQISGKSF